MIDRRAFIFLTGAAGALAACGGGPPGPATVNVAASGAPGMNPGPDGADRPVTISLLRLRDVGAFNSADFFALQDPATALAADLVGMQQIAVAPGESATATVTLEPEATALGVVALLREPSGKVWRTVIPAAPGSTVTANLTVGPGGLVVATS